MEETLTPQERRALIENIKETDDLVKEFFEEACKDPAVLRS